MPRKGSRKVRSGCLTCKARKVKCDEGKPSCQRCVIGGRVCQGLDFSNQAKSSLQLVQPRNHVLGDTVRSESRVMEFFCNVAAPSLSGPIDPYFWTHIVLQLAELEPCVRHSVMTISSLFENRRSRDISSAVAVQRNVVALKHYNAAIRELQGPRRLDLGLTLLTCLLFVCIEVLHANGDIAIRHCYHGINLMGTSDPPETSRVWPLQMYHVCTVLSTVIFTTDETDYDEFIPTFKELVKGAGELAGLRTRPTKSEFHFEMGFAPFLFFVAIKCRDFETRMEGLRLMSVLCAAQESLWNSHTLQVVAQRIIDLEHGITTGEESTSYYTLPDDNIRVRHFVVGPVKSGTDGLIGREISFYMPLDDGIYIKREIFSMERLREPLDLQDSPGVFAVDLATETLLMTELKN
ncbi:hypothetical protein FPOAC1_011715 [Fusarium poae]|uniref:hypothetical protein n=1 Tax=Fusarium poae TaxID=36050 RepID=UPI001CEBDEB7|nr:hypothetical protein FPOAC1_011715 [Fusarium poae]KAG8666893.1 hypothetical protein FPOAC1_011715 [Fusarium poae]